MTNAFKVRLISGAFGLIAIISTAAWAETPVPADISKEDTYLDVLPKVDVPENVEPVPGAVNEEFRNCRTLWPVEYELSQKGAEARAYRDIYGFIKVRNVIERQDCSCVGKVASWEIVEQLAQAIREKTGAVKLRSRHTDDIHEAAEDLFPVAETMCGGKF